MTLGNLYGGGERELPHSAIPYPVRSLAGKFLNQSRYRSVYRRGWGGKFHGGEGKLWKKSRDNSRAILPRLATLIPTLIRRGERKVAAGQGCNVQVSSRGRERRVIERGRRDLSASSQCASRENSDGPVPLITSHPPRGERSSYFAAANLSQCAVKLPAATYN